MNTIERVRGFLDLLEIEEAATKPKGPDPAIDRALDVIVDSYPTRKAAESGRRKAIADWNAKVAEECRQILAS